MLSANPHLMTCEVCNGTGSNPEYDELNSILFEIQRKWPRDEKDIFIENCKRCGGDGYIDWAENATKKRNRDCKRPMMKNIRETCIYFLYSCLFSDDTYSSYFINYLYYCDDYYITFNVNLNRGIKYFYNNIGFVDKYLLPKDRRMFFMLFHRLRIKSGFACTHCFKMIPVEYFKDKYKSIVQRIAMTPEIEMDYWELYLEDANYPKFILCDNCYFKLNSEQISNLKKEAFNSYNPSNFSVIHDEKLLEYLYVFHHDKYFNDFSEYSKI
jgi:hypothetical protein